MRLTYLTDRLSTAKSSVIVVNEMFSLELSSGIASLSCLLTQGGTETSFTELLRQSMLKMSLVLKLLNICSSFKHIRVYRCSHQRFGS